MLNKDMYALGSKRSAIRELYEFGKKRIEEVGKDNVFDFSLGNPNVTPPACVNQSIKELLTSLDDISLHGYTSAQGDVNVRSAVAFNLSKREGIEISKNNIYMTCGAAASLCITLRSLCEEGDEFIILAPYFPEYKVFVKSQGGKCVVIPFDKTILMPDMTTLKNAINTHTKAVIINSPNNPSGVVYSGEIIEQIASILSEKSREFSREIFIISDEPYREIVYDVDVASIMSRYANTIVCYSYSKSLSLPGDRIGYIAVSPKCTGANDLYLAICGAGRALGYVCAPSTYQHVVEKCVDAMPNISEYRKNRDLLYSALSQIGYDCIQPDGAFYLMFKSLEEDSLSFCEKAKDFDLLLVAGDDFGAKGYVRVAYCVDYDMINRSIPAFKKLYDSYRK